MIFSNAGNASNILQSDQFYAFAVMSFCIGFVLLPRRMVLLSTAIRLFIVSGLLGYAHGSTYFAGFQTAVEPAQVLAGIVKYPSNSSFYLYQVNNWTILHQIGFLAFRLGFNESQLSNLLSGLQLACAYQALTLLSFTVSRSAVFSLLLIPFMEAIHMRGYSEGFNYPLSMVSGHTYGVFSVMFPMAALGLIGSGAERLGGLLLGLSLAVHPATGSWSIAMVVFSLVLRFKFQLVALLNERRRLLSFLGLGLCLSAASFIFHRIAFYVPPVESMSPEQVLKAQTHFLLHWDAHRYLSFHPIKTLFTHYPDSWNSILRMGIVPILFAGLFSMAALTHVKTIRLSRLQIDLFSIVVALFVGGCGLVALQVYLMDHPFVAETYPVFL